MLFVVCRGVILVVVVVVGFVVSGGVALLIFRVVFEVVGGCGVYLVCRWVGVFVVPIWCRSSVVGWAVPWPVLGLFVVIMVVV